MSHSYDEIIDGHTTHVLQNPLGEEKLYSEMQWETSNEKNFATYPELPSFSDTKFPSLNENTGHIVIFSTCRWQLQEMYDNRLLAMDRDMDDEIAYLSV